MKKYIALIITTIFFFSIRNSIAQYPSIKFEHIAQSQGLSQNTVNSIIQDSDGFIWFGTLDGLNKYDGYKITVYRNSPDDHLSIADNQINVVFEDKNKNLWIGAGNGLSRYNKDKNNFISFKNNPSDNKSICNDVIKSIFEDSDGRIWIGTADGLSQVTLSNQEPETIVFENHKFNGDAACNQINKIIEPEKGILWLATEKGVLEFNTGTLQFTSVKVFKTTPAAEALTTDKINVLLIDKAKNIWIGTSTGLAKIDNQKKVFFYRVDANNLNSISGNDITTIFEDKSNDIWIGTRENGLNKLLQKENNFQRFQYNASNPNSISVNNILSVFQDRFGILWIGTSLGGVNKWDKTAAAISLYRNNPFDENSLNSNQIRCILQDKAKNIWIGTVDKGLNKWDVANNKFTRYQHIPNNPKTINHNHVRSLAEDKNGNIWIATDGGGLDKLDVNTQNFTHFVSDEKNPNGLPNNNVWKVFIDSRGTLWVATFGGGLCKLENEQTQKFTVYKNDPKNQQSISDDRVTTIFEDKNNTLWIGTFGGGLNRFDEKTQTFKYYDYDESNKKSLWSDRIYCITEDSQGMMWLGTKGSLNRFDRQTQTFKRFTEENGLPNNVIMGILEDSRGNLWLSTNNGIAKFNIKTNEIRNYDIDNGLQSNEFLVGAYYKDNSGKFYFGGINGLNVFLPENVVGNQIAPQVVIDEFKIYNHTVMPGDKSVLKNAIQHTSQIDLPWNQNVLSFEFAALHYSQPEKNNYKYILENFDKEWITTDSKHRFATYTNLEPGDYIFKVNASNSDGVWNEKVTEIKIHITPPIWKTLWFRILVILLVVGIIYSYYRSRINRIEKQKLILEKTVIERTHEVQLQKKEIETQRDQLATINKAIEEQNAQIKSSIGFALTIQDDVLSVQEKMNQALDAFIFFRPRDPISSDFFWFADTLTEKNTKRYFIALVRTTGRGIQAAYMAMMGSKLLNKLVKDKAPQNPAEILENFDKAYQSTFENAAKESMRIGLYSLEELEDGKTKIIFSGAGQPFYYYDVRKIESHKIDGNKRIIGFSCESEVIPFEQHEILLSKEDVILMATDGIGKQKDINGVEFGLDKFIDIIRLNSHLTAAKMRDISQLTLEFHQGEGQQTDDILVMGVKL